MDLEAFYEKLKKDGARPLAGSGPLCLEYEQKAVGETKIDLIDVYFVAIQLEHAGFLGVGESKKLSPREGRRYKLSARDEDEGGIISQLVAEYMGLA